MSRALTLGLMAMIICGAIFWRAVSSVWSLNLNEWSNVATIIAACAAVVAFTFSSIQTWLQASVREFQNAIEINREIDKYWSAAMFCNSEEKYFRIGQLISLYETICFMFNRKLVGPLTVDFFQDHVSEIAIKIATQEDFTKILAEICSGENTYCELKKFIKNRKKKFADNWEHFEKAGLA